MKYFILIATTLSLLNSCNSQNKIKALPPIKVAAEQYVYHYTSQKDLDTLELGFKLKGNKRSFTYILESGEIPKNLKIKKWDAEKIKKFEDSIQKTPSFTNISLREVNKWEDAFSIYCKQGEMKDRLATIKTFAEKSGSNQLYILISLIEGYKYRAPLDYFMCYGTDSIKKETTKILIKLIKNGETYNIGRIMPLLADNSSEEYYRALKQNKRLDRNMTVVAPELARLGGVKAMEDILNTIDYLSDKYLRKEYLIEDLELIFNNLYRFHKIDNKTKAYHNKRLAKYNLDVDLLLAKNKKLVYQLDIDMLEEKALKLGLLTKKLTKNQRFQIAESAISKGITARNFLKNIHVIFSYKSTHYASGHLVVYSTPDYSGIMEQFMIALSTDLPNYFTATRLYKDSGYTPHNYLFLTNGQEGFVLKTKDKDEKDYDHKAVSLLFETVLKHHSIDKQFIIKKDKSLPQYNVFYGNEEKIKQFLKLFNTTMDDISFKYL